MNIKNHCCIALAWVSAAAIIATTALLVVVTKPGDDTERLQQLQDARQKIMMDKKGGE